MDYSNARNDMDDLSMSLQPTMIHVENPEAGRSGRDHYDRLGERQ